MSSSDAVEEYWRAKADSLGEAISYKSIAQMYRGNDTERLGILFLTDRHLLFEYTLNPRRGVLGAIFRRDQGPAGEETVSIPLAELRRVGLVAPGLARRWARRNSTPAEVSARIPSGAPAPLAALIFGTCLAVCTDTDYLAFNTPGNQEWLNKLA